MEYVLEQVASFSLWLSMIMITGVVKLLGLIWFLLVNLLILPVYALYWLYPILPLVFPLAILWVLTSAILVLTIRFIEPFREWYMSSRGRRIWFRFQLGGVPLLAFWMVIAFPIANVTGDYHNLHEMGRQVDIRAERAYYKKMHEMEAECIKQFGAYPFDDGTVRSANCRKPPEESLVRPIGKSKK